LFPPCPPATFFEETKAGQKQIKRGFASLSGAQKPNDVVFVGTARTPVGSFRSALANVSAVQLGATAIKKALENAGVGADKVEEVLMGNVVGAGVGQAPARQAALAAGIPESAVCTTINKVCASGMKTIEFAALSLAAGMSQVAVAGGMESMSNVPFYVRRGSVSFGNQTMEDGILKDGLWDVYNDVHMGMCAEETAEKVCRLEEER